ncbi:hypothetical protein FJTKL_04705 [Diaporthe vaccinii]|uniref:Uncharacterized protein n=1 Tax=Diaporthe vaccinii TaxID=105482 RepID=A0ABR4EZQ8_9PEZI
MEPASQSCISTFMTRSPPPRRRPPTKPTPQIFHHERLDPGIVRCTTSFVFEIFSSLTEISIPLLVDNITHSLACPFVVRRPGYVEFVSFQTAH